MQIIRGSALVKSPKPCVAVMGNFDGMHRGHQAVLDQLMAQAQKSKLPSTVIFFEPQPQEFILPASAPARLMRCRDKLAFLSRYGIDQAVVLPFNRKLQQCSPEDFIHLYLHQGLNVQVLLADPAIHFGRQRTGDLAVLKSLGAALGMQILSLDQQIMESGDRISSTAVRHALAAGNCQLAEKLLGRPYELSGVVIQGDQLGRRLGYPTANMALHRLYPPAKQLHQAHNFPTRLLNAPNALLWS